MNPIVYIDMDNTLVDFSSGIDLLELDALGSYGGNYDDAPGIFGLMRPMPGAIEAVRTLSEVAEVFVLSTAPWDNPSAWSDKVGWIRHWFGAEKSSPVYKRLILSHHKQLNRGDYLIDDRPGRGAAEFEGEWVRFASDRHPHWPATVEYLLRRLHGAEREGRSRALPAEHSTLRYYDWQPSPSQPATKFAAVTRDDLRHFYEWDRDTSGWTEITAARFVDARESGFSEVLPIDVQDARRRGRPFALVDLPMG